MAGFPVVITRFLLHPSLERVRLDERNSLSSPVGGVKPCSQRGGCDPILRECDSAEADGAIGTNIPVVGHRIAQTVLCWRNVASHLRVNSQFPPAQAAIPMTAEHRRLEEARERSVPWKSWGPYLSERQWGTVREDYSEGGTPGTTLPTTRPARAPTAGGRTAWPGSPTISSGSASRWPSGMGRRQRRRARGQPPDRLDGRHRPTDAPVRDPHARPGDGAREEVVFRGVQSGGSGRMIGRPIEEFPSNKRPWKQGTRP